MGGLGDGLTPSLLLSLEPLVSRDVADGTNRRAADLARPLSDRIRYGEDLRRLLVEQQVIVAKVAPADVPVKVLGLHVNREHVGKQST